MTKENFPHCFSYPILVGGFASVDRLADFLKM